MNPHVVRDSRDSWEHSAPRPFAGAVLAAYDSPTGAIDPAQLKQTLAGAAVPEAAWR